MEKRVNVEIDHDQENEKCMYICSSDYKWDGSRCYAIRAIKLSDLLSCSCFVYEDEFTTKTKKCDRCSSNSGESELRKVVSMSDPDLPFYPGCGVVDNQIFFCGGEYVRHLSPFCPFSKRFFVFRTNDPEVIIKDGRSCFGEFLEGKSEPKLFLVEGNLYALARLAKSCLSFDKFERESNTWLPMPDVPFNPFFLGGRSSGDTHLSYAVTGSKIMVCSPGIPVYCFDVADPKQGWKQLSSMCSGHPFPFRGGALVLNHHPEKLLFAYQATSKAWAIVAYRMISNDSQIKRIKVLKPRLPREFTGLPHSFVHLGGPYVCLVVANFLSREELAKLRFIKVKSLEGKCTYPCPDDEIEKMRLLFITFKYSFSESFSSKILSSRILEYNWSEDGAAEVGEATMPGCFLL